MWVVGHRNRFSREWSPKAARAQKLLGQHSEAHGEIVGARCWTRWCLRVTSNSGYSVLYGNNNSYLTRANHLQQAGITNLFFFNQVLPSPCPRQVRSYYVDWRMLRDVKRRKTAYEYADERLRINAIRKNSILPKELQVVAAGCAQPGHQPTLHRSKQLSQVTNVVFLQLTSTKSCHVLQWLQHFGGVYSNSMFTWLEVVCIVLWGFLNPVLV